MKSNHAPIDPKRCPDFFDGQKITRSARNRINRREGDEAQEIVERFMREQGFRCVERIETGFSVIRKGRQIVGAFPKRAVSGDIKAIGSRRKAVHVEVKHRPGDRLLWSAFEKHQIEAMENVTKAGGMAFVAWVTSLYPPKLFWLLWPIPGLRKGKSLTHEDATKHRGDHFGFVNGTNPM
jgi:hypothetical protein